MLAYTHIFGQVFYLVILQPPAAKFHQHWMCLQLPFVLHTLKEYTQDFEFTLTFHDPKLLSSDHNFAVELCDPLTSI